jgi:O-antigen/teichoic acid export membrane protein
MEFSLFSAIIWKIITFLWILFTVFILFKKTDFLDYSYPFYFIMLSWLAWIVLNTWLNYFYAKKLTHFWFDFDIKYIKHIFRISIPYWLALFLSVVYFKVDIVLLSIIEPEKLSNFSIALYTLPMKIVEVLMVVWWFYLNSILWELSKNYENKNFKEINKILNISFKILFSFSLFLLVLWTLFRDNIIEIIANKDYINSPGHIFSSSNVFFIVLLVLVFYFISNLFIYVLISSNNESKLLKINMVVAIFNIIGNIIVIPKFSFMWSWIITVLSQILLLMLWYLETRNITKFNIPIKYILINILFSIFIYILWIKLITWYSISLYFDVIVYWWLLWFIFLIFYYYLYRKSIIN